MTAKKKASFQDQLRGSLRTVIDLEAQERIRRLTSDEALTPEQPTRPIIKPLYKPQDQTDRQTARQSNNQHPPQPIYQDASKPVNQPVEQPEEEPDTHTERLTAPQNGQLTNNPSVSQPANPTINHTINHTTNKPEIITYEIPPTATKDHSINQSHSFSLSQSLIRDRLNPSQRDVLHFLLKTNPYIVKFREIGDCVGLGEATVRTIMRRLEHLDFLTFKKARDGNLQGIRISFNQHLCEQFLSGQAISQTNSRSLSHSFGGAGPANPPFSTRLTSNQTLNQSVSHSQNQPENQTANQPDKNCTLIDRKKEILPIKEEHLEFRNWTDAFIELNWPFVFTSGFRAEQVHQALTNLEELGKKADKKKFSLSLDHAEWEMATYGCLFDGKGEKVKNPVSFIYRALAQWGWFRAHAEFKSQEEDLLLEAERELQHLGELQEKVENMKFEIWKKSLSPESLQKIMENRRGPEDVWLRNYYRENVKEKD
jgi:hypothetical protein